MQSDPHGCTNEIRAQKNIDRISHFSLYYVYELSQTVRLLSQTARLVLIDLKCWIMAEIMQYYLTGGKS